MTEAWEVEELERERRRLTCIIERIQAIEGYDSSQWIDAAAVRDAIEKLPRGILPIGEAMHEPHRHHAHVIAWSAGPEDTSLTLSIECFECPRVAGQTAQWGHLIDRADNVEFLEAEARRHNDRESEITESETLI